MSPPGTMPVGVAETTDHAANHARRWWILAVLGVAQLMVILDSTVTSDNTWSWPCGTTADLGKRRR